MLETVGFIKDALVVLHFIGLAALFGGWFVQIRAVRTGAAKIIPAMVHGAWTMFATGLLIVGMREWEQALGGGRELDHVKIAVKTVVVLVILVLVLANKKKDPVKNGVFAAIGALTLANIIIAVYW